MSSFGTDIAHMGQKASRMESMTSVPGRISMNNEILTVQEVANYLRIDIRTVYRLAKKGDIPCIKIGRQWRFNRNDIKDLVNAGHRTGETGRSDIP
jgi:excisionase family DNA binding protein